jgi:hypothetical protein
MVASLAIALCALTPTFVCANPLLSGYGGPGQGDQAILGATLLNGPSTGGSSEASAGTAAALTATESATARSGSGGRRETVGASRRTRRSRSSAPAKKPGQQGKSDNVLGTLTLRSDDSSASDPLGLSGTDILYILLTLGALALTGGLTRQLVRRPQ